MSLTSLSTAKEWLRITHTKEDTVLQLILDGLEEWLANYLGVRFNESSGDEDVEEYLDGGAVNLWVTQKPMLTLTEIEDRDTGSEYAVTIVRSNDRRIWRDDESDWDPGPLRWKVTYTAGYTAATLPKGITMIIYQMIYRAYNKRGGEGGVSSMGSQMNWEELMESDIVKMARPYIMRGVF